MNLNALTSENLRRVFTEGFVARDIAEPLISFDACTASSEVVEVMKRQGFDIVGIRKEGVVVGYVERADLAGAACGEKMLVIEPTQTISESASLTDVVLQQRLS